MKCVLVVAPEVKIRGVRSGDREETEPVMQ
jgi:hypothetical protein